MPTNRLCAPLTAAAALILAAATPGCGKSDDLKLAPVSGKLLMNGAPLEGASLLFLPDADPKLPSGSDLSGQGGTFKAMTRNRPGLVPGKYKVVVTKPIADASKKAPKEIADDPYMAKLAGLGKDESPDIYAAAETTPLKLEVPEGGEEGIEFDLKSGSKKP